ncbi:hypothetical protein [Vulcanisaeta thermophila]|uniref:hypothetical protein n=1 Tax=Vulcanisaeta thermophila TaxID=867917 RepID=UPI000852C6A0|nr:hypothetical protein [Vulcanisaeta thermophila]
MSDCLEELLNSLMTYISIAQIEHYLLLLLIHKALRGAEVQDQLLNILQSHLNKELTILRKIEQTKCVEGDAEKKLTEAIDALNNELNTYKDPEFISMYINNFNNTLKTLGTNLLQHMRIINEVVEHITIRVINETQNELGS